MEGGKVDFVVVGGRRPSASKKKEEGREKNETKRKKGRNKRKMKWEEKFLSNLGYSSYLYIVDNNISQVGLPQFEL